MKKILSMLMALLMLGTTVFADIPASEYEHLTHTRYTDYLVNYHMTLEETIEDGLKGGEGFQCMYVLERHDKDPKYVIRGYDTCGVWWSKDGAKTWNLEEWDPMNTTKTLSMGVNDIEYHPDDPEIVFSYRWGAANESIAGGLYVSYNGGVSSTPVWIHGTHKQWRNADMWINFGAYDEERGKRPLYLVRSSSYARSQGGLYVSWDWDDRTKWDKKTPAEGGITFERIAFDPDEYGMIGDFKLSYDKKVMTAVIQSKKAEDGTWSADLAKGEFYVSFDQGKTWTKRNKGIEEFNIYASAIDPEDNTHWLASPRGVWEEDPERGKAVGYVTLYETKDSGLTWNKVLVEDWNVPIEKTVEEKDQVKDENGNPTGVSALNLNKRGSSYIHTITIGFTNSEGIQPILIGVQASCWPYRISFDDGKTFGYINNNMEHYLGKDETGWYDDPFAVSEAVPDEILCAIWKSDDGGRDFYWNDSGVSGKLVNSFVFGADGQLEWIAGFDVGVFEVVQGYEGDFPPLKPHRRSNAFANATAAALVQDPNDPNHYFGIAGTNSYTQEQVLVETFDNFVHSRYYINMQMRRRERSEEAGNVNGYLDQENVAYAPNDPNVVYSTYFYSNDNGKTWRESLYSILAVDAFNSSVCYAMSKNQIMISYDGAKTWEGTGVTLNNIRSCFVADSTEPFVVWAGEHNTEATRLHRVDLKTGTVKTLGADQGITTGRIGSSTGLQFKNIAISPVNPNVMLCSGTDYYGQHFGIFISFDAGNSWMEIPDKKPMAGMGNGCFHPTKQQYWGGGATGIWVFDYGAYAKDNNIPLMTNE